MIKADKYLKETIQDIVDNGNWDKNPRPKWTDGTPAHAKYVTQKVFKYNILAGEFPITTLRTPALKGAFHDIEAIYIKQTNIIEEMHSSIHSWWEDFAHKIQSYGDDLRGRSIGQTYGATVKRYDLVNKLLEGMEKNPFSRRHMMNLWQERQMYADPKALVPCAYQTNWNIREDVQRIVDEKSIRELVYAPEETYKYITNVERTVRYIDLTLHQRSQDFCITSSINGGQYVMLGMMVCNHLTFKTGIEHKLANFMHIVENCHIYDRHMDAAKELLERRPIDKQPIINLICEPKDLYSHTIDDFEFSGLEGIKPLSMKLELAV